jgi:PKD repeat protein
VTFSDTSVDDLDGGTIVSRVWEFGDPASGDANAAEGAQASHRYTTVGTFTVRLTVTDDDGVSASVADVVSVEP